LSLHDYVRTEINGIICSSVIITLCVFTPPEIVHTVLISAYILRSTASLLLWWKWSYARLCIRNNC